MKIKTANGELELPKDFSIKIEKTNPILSDKGDVSVPATLPASTHNFEVLGHRERIDRATRYTNKFDAIMSVGPITKRGHLVVDTIQIHNGVDAVFAMDNSDLYVQYKEKTIKEIFNSANNGAGYIVQLGNTPNNAMIALQAAYETGNVNGDWMVFPVAVSPYKSGDKTYYQYNNEIDQNGNLVCAQRNVHEGDTIVTVPYGYGISPFIRLYKMINIMFGILGYTVTNNFFSGNDYKNLVLVNNCADTICKDIVHLNYADMVPSCTLSEFLEWLNNKFHAQAFINSDAKTVRIVSMEGILGTDPDKDISNLIENDLSVQLMPKKRIVLKANAKDDENKPAAESFDKLVEKYGGFYVQVDETNFENASEGVGAFDCLIRRQSTGDFYLLYRDLNANNEGYDNMVPVRLGSAYFDYDRENSDEEESFDQEDVLPAMLFEANCKTAPYIGERTHFHTGYKGKDEEDKQEIICVRGVIDPTYAGYKTSGTVSPWFQDGRGIQQLPFGLAPFDMYSYFWAEYNNLLLSNAPHVKARVNLKEADFLGINMAAMKLCRHQQLIPIAMSANVTNKISPADSEFILAKEPTDKVTDTMPTALNSSPLRWDLTNDIETAFEYYKNHVAYDYYRDGVHYYTSFINISSSATYIDDLGLYWMGVPTTAGETHQITRRIRYVIHYWKYAGDSTSTDTTTAEVDATVTFTAVTNS